MGMHQPPSKEIVPSLKQLVILSTLDSKQSHPDTVLTAMDKVKEVTEKYDSGSTTISCSCGSTMGLF